MKKSPLIFFLLAPFVFIFPVLADTTQVKIVARAPIETIGTDGGVTGVMTLTTKGTTHHRLYYFFAGHGDTKITVWATCHGEAVDHYTPLFEEAIKTLVQE